MDIEKLDINAVCFGILCNFTPVCGEERAKEAAGFVRMLQAENAQLRADLEYEREHADAYYEECGQWEAENEKLRAELKEAEMKIDSLLDEEEKVAFYPFGVEKED